MQHIMLLSSSRAGSEDYLSHAVPMIDQHLSVLTEAPRSVVFIPYAGVTMSYDDYTAKVADALPHLPIVGIHTFESPQAALNQADAVMVGGGNTFHLLHQLYEHDLLNPLRQQVNAGVPYIGWSAGSNIAGLSIKTTNDMPIIEPKSFDALAMVPFQLNPHYSDYQPPNHNGETRDQRLQEFTTLNPDTPIFAIREGTALIKSGDTLSFVGTLDGFIFLGNNKQPILPGQDLSNWLL